MSRNINSWRPFELGLTALGQDGLSDKSSNLLPNHRSNLSGLVQCWQQRQCSPAHLDRLPGSLGACRAGDSFCHALRERAVVRGFCGFLCEHG